MSSNVIQVGSESSSEHDVYVEEPIDTSTVMGDLRAALAVDVSVEPIALNVPNRSTINMVFRPKIDFDMLKRWTKASRESKKADAPVDQKKLCSIILAETCVGMQYWAKKKDGTHVWVDMAGQNDGEPMTFKHPETQSMLGSITGSWMSAIEKMYGSDGHIITVAKIVLDRAGYGDFDLEDGGDPLDN